MEDVHLEVVRAQVLYRVDDRLDGPLHVGLDDDVELLGLTCLILGKEAFQAEFRSPAYDLLSPFRAFGGDLPCDLVVGYDLEAVASIGHAAKS